jgi:putative ABC transport system permease protein
MPDLIVQDARYALRRLVRAPGFTAVVVITLALGLGANTAIFSIVRAELLRPLPFRDPQRLVWVAERNDKLQLATFGASALNYLSWKEQARSLDPLGAIGSASLILTGTGEPEQLAAGTITPSVIDVLGLRPLLGRAFRIGEDAPGAAPIVMLGERFWRRRFAGDASLVGHSLTLSGIDHLVVGIVPDSLNVIAPNDVFVPMVIDPRQEKRLHHVTTVVARLRDGLDSAQAHSEMDAVAREVGRQYPETKDWGIRLVDFDHFIVSDQVRTSLWVLLGAVACVLLVTCANVGHLLLARGLAREKELAVRTALGASRWQLLRQLMIESLALALCGGALGLVAAAWTVRVVEAALPPNVMPVAGIRFDPSVLLFSLGLSVATGALFGSVPAWHALRAHLSGVMRQGGRGPSGGLRLSVRNALAASELALATVLLIGAGLLAKSLDELQRVDLGFRPEGVLTFQVSPPLTRYPLDGGAQAFYRRLLESLGGAPGVTGVAVSSGLPFGAGNYTQTPVAPVASTVMPADAALTVDWRLVSADYFRVLGIPLLAGRAFEASDDAGAAPSIVVSRSLARKFWGREAVIGQSLRRVADGREFNVIGVVGDARNTALNQMAPAMYFSSASRLWPVMDVAVRTVGSPEAAVPVVRERLRELDPELPLSNVRPLSDWVHNGAAQPRLSATALLAFAAMALLVAGIGTYGVLAYSVSRRTGEIGVRMALGAERGRVVAMVLREGLRVAGLGIAGGLALALALGQVLDSLVFGVTVRDPLTFAVVGLVLLLVSLAASGLPAHRAARVDPIVALRYE